MTMATMRPRAVKPIAMYIDCRYLGARLLAKIDPMLDKSVLDKRRLVPKTHAAPAEFPISWFSPTAVLRLK